MKVSDEEVVAATWRTVNKQLQAARVGDPSAEQIATRSLMLMRYGLELVLKELERGYIRER